MLTVAEIEDLLIIYEQRQRLEHLLILTVAETRGLTHINSGRD